MNEQQNNLIMNMIAYDKGMAKQIQHFIKVYEFSKLIGEREGLPEKEQHVLETAAILHDVGIKVSMEKYGSSDGKHQEAEGPAIARRLLEKLDYEGATIERVCYLIAHHHTYNKIEGLDYQILVEADFLVNLYEDALPQSAAESGGKKLFKTETGKRILEDMF